MKQANPIEKKPESGTQEREHRNLHLSAILGIRTVTIDIQRAGGITIEEQEMCKCQADQHTRTPVTEETDLGFLCLHGLLGTSGQQR